MFEPRSSFQSQEWNWSGEGEYFFKGNYYYVFEMPEHWREGELVPSSFEGRVRASAPMESDIQLDSAKTREDAAEICRRFAGA